MLVTNDNGLTFTGATLSNPIPSGQLVQPVGSGARPAQPARAEPRHAVSARSRGGVLPALGSQPAARLARRLGERVHLHRIARREPAGRARDQQHPDASTCRRRAPATPRTSRSCRPTCPTRSPACCPAARSTARPSRAQQLLRPFPEFGTFAIEEYNGSDRYDAATVQIEKRFRSGNSLTAQYTRSSLHDKLNFLNPQDGVLEDRVSPNDRPNRFSIGTSLRLPFGRSEHWGKDWNQAIDAVLGGWQMSGTYQYQDGFPLSWASSYYDASCGDPTSARLEHRREGERRRRRPRRAGVGRLVLLLPRRGGPDQRRRQSRRCSAPTSASS